MTTRVTLVAATTATAMTWTMAAAGRMSQLISIDGSMGVGVPWCWCSSVTKEKKMYLK